MAFEPVNPVVTCEIQVMAIIGTRMFVRTRGADSVFEMKDPL